MTDAENNLSVYFYNFNFGLLHIPWFLSSWPCFICSSPT